MTERILPKVAVSAVLLRKVAAQTQVLLAQRATEPLRLQWSLPGGKLRLFESMTEAIQREILEETGLRLTDVTQLGATELIEPPFHYVIVVFASLSFVGTDSPGDDVQALAWVATKALEPYALSTSVLWAIETAQQAFTPC